MEKYNNRREAGKKLAQELNEYVNRDDVIVLALPRGGVPVAFEVAKALRAPLDVFIVRKLGVPGHSELAMGAIAMGDTCVFNQDIIDNLNISQVDIQSVIVKEQHELKRRELVYRGSHPFPSLKNKNVILIDDGIATGASIRAAIESIYQLNPANLIVAVPVAANDLCEQLQMSVDKFICPIRPNDFYAVGAWYQDFSQTEDAEVYSLLQESKHH